HSHTTRDRRSFPTRRSSDLIFEHDAKGDVPPIRELKTPHRTYGIAVDEAAQELFLTVQYAPQVVVYRKQAAGAEKPIRTLEGERSEEHTSELQSRVDLVCRL